MSDHTPFGFGKFIPGFDFLQNLSKAGQSSSGMPSMSHWVAPTVSVEEISKRIEELKAVQFWLEQNSRALTATVQALEVQKMTLSTLKGMNVSMNDLAKAFTGAAGASAAAAPAAPAAAQEPARHAAWPMSSTSAPQATKTAAPQAEPERAQATSEPEQPAQAKAAAGASDHAAPGAGLGDPMLWWGALSQQFQQIAAQALQDPAQQQAVAQATHMASDFTKAAMNAASSMVRQASEGVKAASTAKPGAKKAAPASAAASKAGGQSAAAPAAKKTAAAKKPAATTARAAASKTAPKTASKAAAPAAAARKRSR